MGSGMASFLEALDPHEHTTATGNFTSKCNAGCMQSFLYLIALALWLKQYPHYILENETYTTEIKVSEIKFLCEKYLSVWKGIYK